VTPTRTRTPRPTPTATPVCGDHVVDLDEECDGDDETGLDGYTCEDLCEGEGGTLRCTSQCTFNFGGCTGKPCEAP
jgi:hypothetical protein